MATAIARCKSISMRRQFQLEAYSCLRRALKHKYIEPSALSLNGSHPCIFCEVPTEVIWQTWRGDAARRVKFPARCLPSLFGLSAGACSLSPVCVCECERARNDKSESNSAITGSEGERRESVKQLGPCLDGDRPCLRPSLAQCEPHQGSNYDRS
jgi:hypothetical protein